MLAVLVTAAVFAHPGFGQPPSADEQSKLAPHVHAIEQAIAARSIAIIQRYLHPQKTYVGILDKPGAYLSVNQAIAVIESFLRVHPILGYTMDVLKEDKRSGIAIGTLLVRSAEGKRALKMTLGFTKEKKVNWRLNRIIIR